MNILNNESRFSTQLVRRLLNALTLAIIPIGINAQQFVLNGSFESYSACANVQTGNTNLGWTPAHYPTGWNMPTLGTPDMISNCGLACNSQYQTNPPACYPQVCFSNNVWGCENLRPGSNVYMGVTTAGVNLNYANSYEFREYLQTVLTPANGLTAGQCYRLEFWVSRGDMSAKATPLEAVLTSSPLSNTNSFAGALSVPAGAQYFASPIIYQKQGWVKISFDFVATGGEKYLTIGGFKQEGDPAIVYDINTPATCNSTSCVPSSFLNDPNNKVGYYYIDDVSLVATAGNTFIPDFTFTNANPTVGGSYSNKNILISGDVTISGNVTFTNCNIRCNDGSSINVPAGAVLNLNGTIVRAGCNNMWDGIVSQGQIIMNGSTIEDAITAIHFNVPNVAWSIDGTTAAGINYFNGNDVDIKITGHVNLPSNCITKGTIFNKVQALKDPTQGNNGFGTYAFHLLGPGNSVPLLIGGPAVADAVTINGGENAIYSEKYTLDLVRLICNNQNGFSVWFKGLNGSYIRNLRVDRSEFNDSRQHIYSTLNTNLQVTSSTFRNAREHSISWLGNRDGQLTIGDEFNSGLGNYFEHNQWAAIACMDNRTGASSASNLLTCNICSEIEIGNNSIIGLPYTTGILVSESNLSANVDYARLVIVKNTISNVAHGILLYNTGGWIKTDNLSYDVRNAKIEDNGIITTTAYTPQSRGIVAINSEGYYWRGNGVASDQTFNWQNYGMMYENSRRSIVKENNLAAGIAINTGGFMYESQLSCNWLLQYAVGFNLCWTALTYGSGFYHGRPGVEQYNNLVPYTSIPWNKDIVMYNSPNANNQWVWNNAASTLDIQYVGNVGSGSVISSLTGSDLCDNLFPIIPFGDTLNPQLTFDDTVKQWEYYLTYERTRKLTGVGDSTWVPLNIARIVNIGDKIDQKSFAEASSLLTGLHPLNRFDSTFATVYRILIDLQFPSMRTPSAQELVSLRTLANYSAEEAGSGVYVARAYLAVYFNEYYWGDLSFGDSDISGEVNLKEPCILGPVTGTSLDLISSDGMLISLQGSVVSANGKFSIDPIELQYYNNQYASAEFRIISKHGSKYTVQNNEYRTLNDWMQEEIILDLSGVTTIKDTLLPSGYPNYSCDTIAHASDGSSYTGGTVNGQLTITKFDGGNNPVWTRSYAGPLNGPDSAICVYVDELQYIYVVGKVWNGKSYDVQMLKYNSEGVLIWAYRPTDPHGADNSPKKLTADGGNGHVSVLIDRKLNGTISGREIIVAQCLSGNNRLQETVLDSAKHNSSSVNIFPNPTSGLFRLESTVVPDLVEIFDVSGHLIKSYFSSATNWYGMEGLSEGVYFIVVTIDGTKSTHKLLVIGRDN